MGRVVILEGPDGGGKTTLAKKLVEAGFEYKHEGPPPPGVDLLAHYLRILYDSLMSKRNVVHDRLWLGERIYGPIVRGVDRIGDEGQTLFDRLHRSKPIHQYICSPKLGVARANYLEKIKEKDDYLKCEHNWTSVFNGYMSWVYNHAKMGDMYNYQDPDSYQNVVDRIMSHKVALGSLPDGTIGSPTAKYLFIGDKPNHLTIDVPFFAVNGSSGYFNKALKLAQIKEANLAVSNAKSAIGTKHSLTEIVRSLPYIEKVFLMGGVAKDWFIREYNLTGTEKLLDFCEIPHPSFLKRFKGHNPQVMADLILEELYG